MTFYGGSGGGSGGSDNSDGRLMFRTRIIVLGSPTYISAITVLR